MIEQISSKSKDSIISYEDFEEESMVEEKKQTTPISDEDFDEEKLGEVDLLVKEIGLLNYRRNRNFHVPCVIQGQTYIALCNIGTAVNIIPTRLMKDLKLGKL